MGADVKAVDENRPQTPSPGVKQSERQAAIGVVGADKVFADGTRALNPINLTIEQGEFVTLIGPSGCGKSTLLKMIANPIDQSRSSAHGHQAVPVDF